jgi:drug/metabolite transporter (DMT)-like permease
LSEHDDHASERRRSSRGYLLAVLAAACWAAGGLTAKWLFEGPGPRVQPAHLSAARAFIAFLMLLVYLLLARRDVLKVRLSDLPFLSAFGVFGLAAVHFTYFATIELTNVPTAILLEYLAPVLVLGVSVAAMGERFTWFLPAGAALSVLGCALVVGAIGGEGLRVSPAGIAWGLASAVFFAGYTLMGKYAAGRYSPWTLLVYGLGAASVFWIAYLGLRGETGSVVTLVSSPVRAAAVTAMAFGATVVPFGAFLKALTYIDATRASITATLEPVIAAVASFAIPALYQPLSPLQLLGGALVLAACVVVQAPSRRRTTLPPAA